MTPGTTAERRRFVLVTVAALLGMALTLRAGFWQLDRAHQKEAAQALAQRQQHAPAWDETHLLSALAAQPPVDERVESQVGKGKGAARPDWLQHPVALRGRWLAPHTVYLDNRSMETPQGPRAGFYVVTPLALAEGGPPMLVLRGWAPRDLHERTALPEVDQPVGTVQVSGRIAPELPRLYSFRQQEEGIIRQNLALDDFRKQTGLAVLPVVVVQTGEASEGLLRHWPAPATGAEKNRGYAVQWFGMAALIAALYVWFQLIRRLRRKPAL